MDPSGPCFSLVRPRELPSDDWDALRDFRCLHRFSDWFKSPWATFRAFLIFPG